MKKLFDKTCSLSSFDIIVSRKKIIAKTSVLTLHDGWNLTNLNLYLANELATVMWISVYLFFVHPIFVFFMYSYSPRFQWFHCKDLMKFPAQTLHGCKPLQDTRICTITSKEFRQWSLGATVARKFLLRDHGITGRQGSKN